jgi:hypothetical protein
MDTRRFPRCPRGAASHDPKGASVATIDRRTSKSGEVTWRVRWREGGSRTGRSDGETCDSVTDARNLAALVQLAGNRRPEGYPKGCRGRKLLQAEESAPDSCAPTFGEVVTEYLDATISPSRSPRPRRWMAAVAP